MVSIVSIVAWEDVLTRRELEKGLHWASPPPPIDKTWLLSQIFCF